MKKTVELVEFKKLNNDIKTEIIDMWIDDIIETTDFSHVNHNSNLWKAYKECQRLQTPWFLGSYIWEKCERMVLKICRQFLYTVDGKYFVAK